MKISHAVSRADSDEEMIQTDDIRAGAEDPGSEETKTVRMKKTPKQPSQREREEHERTHLPSRPDVATVPRHSPAGESQSNGERNQESSRTSTCVLRSA